MTKIKQIQGGKKQRRGKIYGKSERGRLNTNVLTIGRVERGESWRIRTKKRNRWKKKKKTRKYVPRKIEKRRSRWRLKKGQVRVRAYGGRKKEAEQIQPSHRRIKGKQRRRRKALRGSRSHGRKRWYRKNKRVKRKRYLSYYFENLLIKKQNLNPMTVKNFTQMRELADFKILNRKDFVLRVQQRGINKDKQIMVSNAVQSLNKDRRISERLKWNLTYQIKKKRIRVRSVSDISGEAHNGCRGKGKRRL